LDPILTDLENGPGFRPRRGSRSRSASERSGGFRNVVLAAMRGSRRFQRSGRPLPRSRVAVRAPAKDARRVVVKAHYVRMTTSGANAARLHLRYIERDGVEKDGSKGVLYSADGPARALTFEQPRVGEQHQFRLILSPEDARELDLTDYVRRLMASVEKDLGRRLEWAAVNHHDTAHPHAHIVLRGVDRDGLEVRLDRGYISNGLRWRAQELATEELGPRLERDIHRAHAKEVTQDRFTSLDRELERRAKDNQVEARSRSPRIDESTLIARLEHLRTLRLAERVGPTAWTLTPGWQDELRELGSRGDIIRQMHRAVSGDPSRYRIVRPGQPLEPDKPEAIITGRVASKGLSDELKGGYFAVIETPTGTAYHVPLGARSAEQLRPGDTVSLTTKRAEPIRPVDREVAEAARAGGGAYILEPTVDGAPHPHVRRLRDLERLGVAKPEAPDRWRIAPNLLEELVKRVGDEPVRHQLFVRKEPRSLEQQVRHPGPVWLDKVDQSSLAHWGFGAELRRAVDQRREALRGFGIAADDAHRDAKLREMERRAVGERMAARTGQQFLAETPDRFRGRLQAGPPGVPYAVIADGTCFVVVPTSHDAGRLANKAVVVGRDPQGQLRIRASDRDLGR
jgi:type IV secretory pathway VirD2 relaxase